MLKHIASWAFVAALAACAPEVQAPASGSSDAPKLEPLSRQDFENELKPGAGCTLRVDGEDLIVAVVGDAVARIDGRVVHLQGGGSDLKNLVLGGRYSGGGMFIDLGAVRGRSEPAVRVGDGLLSRRVEVRLDRGEERWSRFEGDWICGA